MVRKSFLVLAFLIVTVSAGFSQEISEKKEIAIFSLSYTDWNIPDGALGLVDQSIQNVFINMKRFDIIGTAYRLNSGDITQFIDEIKKIKESTVEIPEGVRLGEQTFTEADFNRLIGSFIIVVPVMSYYDVSIDDGGYYSAEVQTSFTFINVEEERIIAGFQIDTSGTDDTPRAAVKAAVDSIPLQLSYEIRKIPEFQLKSGVIQVNGKEVYIELGSEMGVKPGDEFSLTVTEILPSGHALEKNAGLLVVKEVNRDISTARIFYSKKTPTVGDQLKEIPRMGFETNVYVNYISVDEEGEDPVIAVGLKQVVARGFYKARPFAGVEIPVGASDLSLFFPLNVFLGGELNWYFGRLHITPSIDLGAGMLVPVVEEFSEYVILSNIGGHARLGVSYMASDDIKINMEAGYTAMMDVSDLVDDGYSGFFAGGGMVFKY